VSPRLLTEVSRDLCALVHVIEQRVRRANAAIGEQRDAEASRESPEVREPGDAEASDARADHVELQAITVR
jgi:hypothetical protein